MQSLITLFSSIVGEAFSKAGVPAELGKVVTSERPDLADFQCNGALAASKQAGIPPQELAKTIASHLSHPAIAQVTIAGPGFINLTISPEFLAEHLRELATDPNFGAHTKTPKKMLIDFGGFNIAKPLHVGHLRSSIVGDSLRRIYQLLGHEVIGDTHLGDWGTPMGMVIEGIRRLYPDSVYFDPSFEGEYPLESPVTAEDLEKIYPEESARCKADPEALTRAQLTTVALQNGEPGLTALWKTFVEASITAAKRDMDLLGVHFDWWYGEAHYHSRIAPLIAQLKADGKAIESEGALIIPLESPKDLPPLLLVKSDSGYLYGTTDLAAIEERIAVDHFDAILYEVDQRQSLHFEQVFTAAYQTGIAPRTVELTHIGHGTVNGADGRPFKSRNGAVMKLHDLILLANEKARIRMEETGIAKDYPTDEQEDIINKVAIAALKYADLKNNRQSDYNFDTEQFTLFEGRTGPYLLYTAVRISSILRKLTHLEPTSAALLAPTEKEKELYLVLSSFSTCIEQVVANNTPHVLAEHLFTLAQAFNHFYQICNISRETDQDLQLSWLSLADIVHRQLILGLSLLGITTPERM